MKIELNKLKIKNFYSYQDVEFEFKRGIYLVDGVNKDKDKIKTSLKTSNGAGKTAFFASVYQTLFNKNIKNPKANIATVNNIYTNKKYELELTMFVDKNKVVIDNSRVRGDILIKQEDKDVTPKGVNSQLSKIQDIIKFNYEMFSSITYLNSQSLENVLDLTNKDSMLYQFFEVDKIKEYEKGIKRHLTKIKTDLAVEQMRKETAEDNKIKLKQKYEELILGDLPTFEELEKQKEELAKFYPVELLRYDQKIDVEEENIRNIQLKIQERKDKLTEIKTKGKQAKADYDNLKKGKCPVCGKDYSQDELSNRLEELKSLMKKKVKLETELEELRNLLTNTNDILYTLKADKQSIQKEYENKLNDLTLLKEKVTAQETLKDTEREAEQEYIEQIKQASAIIDELEKEIIVSEELLNLVKSGKLLDVTLGSYTDNLQKFYDYYKDLTGFEICCEIYYKNGKILNDFSTTDGAKKTFSNLSTGERTRVAIIFLISTLRTLEMLLNISINFLVLDELLGVLDEDGVEMLKSILNDLKKTKSIFVITHHNEIEPEFADFMMVVEKSNNKSSIIIKEMYERDTR